MTSSAIKAPPLPANSQVRIGHVHLKVADLDRSLAFYRDVLGFTVTQRYGSQAVFLSAGGYHHHLGLNTWGAPRLAQPTGALGLAEATFALAGLTAPKSQRDPDGIALHLIAP
jgi:catechol-2,3-dioxygenase